MLEVASLTISAAGNAPPARVCGGVPPWNGPRVECGEPLAEDRLRNCARCDREIERRVVAEAAKHADDGRRAALQAAGLSRPFVDGTKSLATVNMLTDGHAEAIEAARRWTQWTPADRNRLGVLLRGAPGLGKSDIAEGAVREVILAGRPAKYINARALAVRLQAAFRDDAPQAVPQILDEFTSAAWLALDDLGATKVTRFVADALYSLLERRARDEQPTFITSNYITLAELAARLRPTEGDDLDAIRPTDRMEELCPKVVTLEGVSMRAVVSRQAMADTGRPLILNQAVNAGGTISQQQVTGARQG